jgi:hypothetical protein
MSKSFIFANACLFSLSVLFGTAVLANVSGGLGKMRCFRSWTRMATPSSIRKTIAQLFRMSTGNRSGGYQKLPAQRLWDGESCIGSDGF